MQVAGFSAPPLAQRAAVQFSAVQVTTHVRIIPADQMSDGAVIALAYIGRSTRLSGADKHTLTRLVAMVDQFAGGDLKLMKAILGIAKIMESHNPEGRYRATSFRAMAEQYWQERALLGGHEKTQVTVEQEISVFAASLVAVAEADPAPAAEAAQKSVSDSAGILA